MYIRGKPVLCKVWLRNICACKVETDLDQVGYKERFAVLLVLQALNSCLERLCKFHTSKAKKNHSSVYKSDHFKTGHESLKKVKSARLALDITYCRHAVRCRTYWLLTSTRTPICHGPCGTSVMLSHKMGVIIPNHMPTQSCASQTTLCYTCTQARSTFVLSHGGHVIKNRLIEELTKRKLTRHAISST